MQEKRSESTLSRRNFLKFLSLGAVSGLSLSLVLGRWGRGRSKKDVLAMDLPGEGSIFEPRKDERLAAWLKKQGRRSGV